jgi:VWFA-related protein
MMHPKILLLPVMLCAASVVAQNAAPSAAQTGADRTAEDQQPELRVTTRNVLVDVIVTDQHGRPVTGLKKDAFTVTESGKPQGISFFEENAPAPQQQTVQIPKMPTDIFTNFTPFRDPPAVNVLLLDTLNSVTDNQMFVHKQALQFLKTAKPGTRMAIFTMGLGLHFIQGFNDDPTVLLAALNNKKNLEVEDVGATKSSAETLNQQNLIGMMTESMTSSTPGSSASPGMIAALKQFIDENDTSRTVDRNYVTLVNLQRLAAFLEGFPGRKNIIWFTEKPPGLFVTGSGGMGGMQNGNPALGDEVSRTLAMLAAARAAIYPVDARGTTANGIYTAENALSTANALPSQMVGSGGAMVQQMNSEDQNRNNDQLSAQIMADQSGGQAFANSNGLAQIIDKISSTSSNFYTLSYSPTNTNMDGSFRNIEIKVAGVPGVKYQLSYRRGYFAVDDALPGSSLVVRNEEIRKLAEKNPNAVDPLLPFMDLGMPQSQQVLYKLRVYPVPAVAPPSAASPAPNQTPNPSPDKAPARDKTTYKIDFAIDATDLRLAPDADGNRKDKINVTLIVYDRYGSIISHEEHLVDLSFKPDAYAAIKNAGVQLHAQLAVPAKGNYWLRTGIFDRGSRKVGTMEIPFAAVKPLEQAAK